MARQSSNAQSHVTGDLLLFLLGLTVAGLVMFAVGWFIYGVPGAIVLVGPLFGALFGAFGGWLVSTGNP